MSKVNSSLCPTAIFLLLYFFYAYLYMHLECDAQRCEELFFTYSRWFPSPDSQKINEKFVADVDILFAPSFIVTVVSMLVVCFFFSFASIDRTTYSHTHKNDTFLKDKTMSIFLFQFFFHLIFSFVLSLVLFGYGCIHLVLFGLAQNRVDSISKHKNQS